MSVNDTNDKTELLTADEAARLLPNTSAQSILRWARSGKIPSVRLPNRRVFFERGVIENLPVYRAASASSVSLVEDQELPGFGSLNGGSGER